MIARACNRKTDVMGMLPSNVIRLLSRTVVKHMQLLCHTTSPTGMDVGRDCQCMEMEFEGTSQLVDVKNTGIIQAFQVLAY